MIGVKEVSLVLILVTSVVMATEDYPGELYQRPYELFMEPGRRAPGMLDKETQLSAIRSIVNDLENRMIKRAPYGGPCLGAGMSHNCEFGDLKEALKHVEQISSGHFPGRRKRFLENGTD